MARRDSTLRWCSASPGCSAANGGWSVHGRRFNGIFAGLDAGRYDCVASGTTITPGREAKADFCTPYAISGQSLVVDVIRNPDVHGIADLKGLVVGVQQGNTSQPVAEKLVAENRAARVRVYAYHEIEQALDDLTSGGCDAFMKLAPVTAWFVRGRPRLGSFRPASLSSALASVSAKETSRCAMRLAVRRPRLRPTAHWPRWSNSGLEPGRCCHHEYRHMLSARPSLPRVHGIGVMNVAIHWNW